MHGNVWTWCQERYKNYSQRQGEKALEDKEDSLSINSQEGRVLRGGSFDDRPVSVRSAHHFRSVPANRDAHVGLRPARTFTAD
jgi:formylglycine-generating enzyme required for sulfatase activity